MTPCSQGSFENDFETKSSPGIRNPINLGDSRENVVRRSFRKFEFTRVNRVVTTTR